jgi:pimeloyl-ACP methyl ester carboxylesterase/glycosyltransferase involved in cell wall biosynthesis
MRLLAPLHSPPASGSDTTIRRIAAHLTAAGHSVLLVPAPEEPVELARTAKAQDIDAMIGHHLFFSGEQFLEVGIPYVLVLGGTDLNEFALEPEYLTVMTEAVERAYAVIAFNDDFVHRCRTLWPQVSDRVHLIPQAVHTEPSDFSLRECLGLGQDAVVLLLPAGLRHVKDPLYLVDCVRQWHAEDPRIHMVIMGLSYESGFLDMVLRRCGTDQGVHYLDALPQADLHAAMRDSTAVLNTSLSECSPNAVLEAMDLGVPVLVRDIPGNTCIVTDRVTGLVFDSRSDFRRLAARIVDDPDFAGRIGARGQEFVRREHRLDAEQAAYASVFQSMREDLLPGLASATRDRLVTVNGVEVWAETFGDPQDPAILLIAGSGAAMLAWDSEFCEQLAAGARYVIRYDHRDTGRSAKYPVGDPQYTLRDLVDDAVGLLDCLDVSDAHLVGASMGGMIAQLAALDHPERVRSLTLLSTSPGGAGPDNPDLPTMSPRFGVALDDVDPPDWSDRAAVMAYLVTVDRLLANGSPSFDEAGRRELAGRVFERADGMLAAAANHLLLEFGEPWRARLGEIGVPVLVVHGTADPMFPIAHGKALAEEIPNARLLVLDHAGHQLAGADQQTVLAALLRHTKMNSGPPSR